MLIDGEGVFTSQGLTHFVFMKSTSLHYLRIEKFPQRFLEEIIKKN